MNDIISRQAAMTLPYLPKEYREYITNNLDDAYEKGWDDCQECIKHIPADYPTWIPVSERLPENNGRYLVTRGLKAAGSPWNRVYIANYSDLMGLKTERIFWEGNVGKNDFEKLDDVLAWMPLPEPYKEEDA